MLNFNDFKKSTTVILILSILVSCSSKKDPVTGEEVLTQTNVKEKAAKYDGSLFGNITRDKGNNTFDFATSNPLWRGALKTIAFMPINNVDYSGGVIVTDWYSEDVNSKQKIKIFINFLSNEIRSDSINIIAHKKTCITSEDCKIEKMDKNFTETIKDNIMDNARKIKIVESKEKK
jgi:hypothetical protein